MQLNFASKPFDSQTLVSDSRCVCCMLAENESRAYTYTLTLSFEWFSMSGCCVHTCTHNHTTDAWYGRGLRRSYVCCSVLSFLLTERLRVLLIWIGHRHAYRNLTQNHAVSWVFTNLSSIQKFLLCSLGCATVTVFSAISKNLLYTERGRECTTNCSSFVWYRETQQCWCCCFSCCKKHTGESVILTATTTS